LRNVKALFLIVGVGKGRWQNDPYGNVWVMETSVGMQI
jgi:hypothetical protein